MHHYFACITLCLVYEHIEWLCLLIPPGGETTSVEFADADPTLLVAVTMAKYNW